MHGLFAELVQGVRLTGDVRADIVLLLAHYGYTKTVEHSQRVAAEAERLAARFGTDPSPAQLAGWLHDVSAVYPVAERAHVARQLGLEVLPEEDIAPMLLHQKLSTVMAREIWAVSDRAVLSAVGCHTTLRAKASLLDKVVFVADKIAWDQPGAPPYQDRIQQALARSLDQAALCYLDYLWQQRAALPAVHPWLVDAHRELKELASICQPPQATE